MNLAELAVGFDTLDRALEASGGELTDELAATLDQLQLAEREKIDRLVFVIRALEGEAEKFKRLEDELCAKKKAKQRSRESLLAYVHRYMDAREVKELKGDVFRFQVVKNGGKPSVEVLVPVEDLPREWTITEVRVNKDAIRSYLEKFHGDEVIADQHMARLGEPTFGVRIY